MSQPQTLVGRPLKIEVRGPRGVAAVCTLAHCSCPDQTWRDRDNVLHFCKHLVHVYSRYASALRKGRTTFRVRSFDPARAAEGLTYKVTAFSCTLADGSRCRDARPGVMELCEHLRVAYDSAGFPAARDRKPAKAA